MSDDSEETLEDLLKKLSDRLGEDGATHVPLNKKELSEVRRMVATYRMVIGWGKLGKLLIWLAMTVSGLFLAYQTLIKSGGTQ